MTKKILYIWPRFVLIFCIVYQLYPGQFKLVNQIPLDDMDILKPYFLKVFQGNIYIYDNAQMAFFILDSQFKLKKKFGSTGPGPSEFRKPAAFGFVNNRLWVHDTSGKLIWYNLDGEYIEEIRQTGRLPNLSIIMEQIDSDKYFVVENQVENNGKKQTLFFYSGLKKTKLAEINESIHNTLDLGSKINFLFSASTNFCYVVPSDNLYYIKRFDIKKMAFSGEIKKKNYQRIRYNEMEIAELNEKVKKIKASNPFLEQFKVNLPVWKPAISNIFCDETDRMYVIIPSTEKGKNFLEVYDSTLKSHDGFFIPQSKLFYPASGHIYIITYSEAEDVFWLLVYSYE